MRRLLLAALAMGCLAAEARADHVEVAGADLEVVFDGGDPSFRTEAHRWVREAASAVADYYGGQFPVSQLRVDVVARVGRGVGFGQAFAGRRIRVNVGRRSDRSDFESDWVLVHEMLHLGFPMLARRHRWMREGLSTYVEPIVRARADLATEEEVWTRLTTRLPNGLPRAGDRGLDHTPTWGRTYWGGALYWLLADLAIRTETQGRKTLGDALRAIAQAGGTARQLWSIERGLRIGDEATGTTVLIDLYHAMRDAPHPVDLDALFAKLGVANPERLDGSAPLADLRRALTRSPVRR